MTVQRDGKAPAQTSTGFTRTDLFTAVATVQKHYVENLLQNEKAMKYLYERGFTDGLIEKYGFGYAKGKSAHKIDGITTNLLGEIGVFRQSKKTPGTAYDPVAGRITIPLHNSAGKITGWTGRALNPNENIKKYINTPETRIFQKGSQLYGYHMAAKMLQSAEHRDVQILEGQLKTLANLEAGYPSISAGGTAFTEKQALMVAQLRPDTVWLNLDKDAAGLKAAKDIAPLLRRHNLIVKVATLQTPMELDGQFEKVDPDDLMAAGYPIKYNGMQLIPWLCQTLIPDGKFKTPENAKILSTEICPMIRELE
ncbi:MAG: toprim domain-containing protein, partial [Porticoccaceae bacterium]|nr:toprim domain-containing protein [Porticoccaceae bacterium]